jgi:hypothetical protein
MEKCFLVSLIANITEENMFHLLKIFLIKKPKEFQTRQGISEVLENYNIIAQYKLILCNESQKHNIHFKGEGVINSNIEYSFKTFRNDGSNEGKWKLKISKDLGGW